MCHPPPLERDPNAQLNLTGTIDRREYPPHAIRKMACHISKDGVSVPSQSNRILRVTGDGKIRMIQNIERFGAQHDFHALAHLETLLHRQIELCKARTAQDIASSSAKLSGRR